MTKEQLIERLNSLSILLPKQSVDDKILKLEEQIRELEEKLSDDNNYARKNLSRDTKERNERQKKLDAARASLETARAELDRRELEIREAEEARSRFITENEEKRNNLLATGLQAERDLSATTPGSPEAIALEYTKKIVGADIDSLDRQLDEYTRAVGTATTARNNYTTVVSNLEMDVANYEAAYNEFVQRQLTEKNNISVYLKMKDETELTRLREELRSIEGYSEFGFQRLIENIKAGLKDNSIPVEDALAMLHQYRSSITEEVIEEDLRKRIKQIDVYEKMQESVMQEIAKKEAELADDSNFAYTPEELEHEQERLDSISKNIDTLPIRVRESEIRSKSLQSDIRTNQEELALTEQAIDILNLQIARDNEEIKTLDKELDADRVEALQSRIIKKTSTLSINEQLAESLKAQIANDQESLAASYKKTTQLQDMYNRYTDLMSTFQERDLTVNIQAKRLAERELDQLRSDLASINKSLEFLERDFEKEIDSIIADIEKEAGVPALSQESAKVLTRGAMTGNNAFRQQAPEYMEPLENMTQNNQEQSSSVQPQGFEYGDNPFLRPAGNLGESNPYLRPAENLEIPEAQENYGTDDFFRTPREEGDAQEMNQQELQPAGDLDTPETQEMTQQGLQPAGDLNTDREEFDAESYLNQLDENEQNLTTAGEEPQSAEEQTEDFSSDLNREEFDAEGFLKKLDENEQNLNPAGEETQRAEEAEEMNLGSDKEEYDAESFLKKLDEEAKEANQSEENKEEVPDLFFPNPTMGQDEYMFNQINSASETPVENDWAVEGEPVQSEAKEAEVDNKNSSDENLQGENNSSNEEQAQDEFSAEEFLKGLDEEQAQESQEEPTEKEEEPEENIIDVESEEIPIEDKKTLKDFGAAVVDKAAEVAGTVALGAAVVGAATKRKVVQIRDASADLIKKGKDCLGKLKNWTKKIDFKKNWKLYLGIAGTATALALLLGSCEKDKNDINTASLDDLNNRDNISTEAPADKSDLEQQVENALDSTENTITFAVEEENETKSEDETKTTGEETKVVSDNHDPVAPIDAKEGETYVIPQDQLEPGVLSQTVTVTNVHEVDPSSYIEAATQGVGQADQNPDTSLTEGVQISGGEQTGYSEEDVTTPGQTTPTEQPGTSTGAGEQGGTTGGEQTGYSEEDLGDVGEIPADQIPGTQGETTPADTTPADQTPSTQGDTTPSTPTEQTSTDGATSTSEQDVSKEEALQLVAQGLLSQEEFDQLYGNETEDIPEITGIVSELGQNTQNMKMGGM